MRLCRLIEKTGWWAHPCSLHSQTSSEGGDLCGVIMQILGFLLSSIIAMAQVSVWVWRSAALLEKRKMMAHQLRPQCGRSHLSPLGVRLSAGLESSRLISSSLVSNLISSFSQFTCIIKGFSSYLLKSKTVSFHTHRIISGMGRPSVTIHKSFDSKRHLFD